MICFFNKYKKSVQKHTDFFDNSFFNAVPDKPLATRNKSHNNQLCTDLSRFNSAYSVVSHFLRFAWQTTFSVRLYLTFRIKSYVGLIANTSQRGKGVGKERGSHEGENLRDRDRGGSPFP